MGVMLVIVIRNGVCSRVIVRISESVPFKQQSSGRGGRRWFVFSAQGQRLRQAGMSPWLNCSTLQNELIWVHSFSCNRNAMARKRLIGSGGKKQVFSLCGWTPLSWSGSRTPRSCTAPSCRSTWWACGCPSSFPPEAPGPFCWTATDPDPAQSERQFADSAETIDPCMRVRTSGTLTAQARTFAFL